MDHFFLWQITGPKTLVLSVFCIIALDKPRRSDTDDFRVPQALSITMAALTRLGGCLLPVFHSHRYEGRHLRTQPHPKL